MWTKANRTPEQQARAAEYEKMIEACCEINQNLLSKYVSNMPADGDARTSTARVAPSPSICIGATITDSGLLVRVSVYNAYSIKGDLKSRGYRFNGINSAWEKAFSTQNGAESEAISLELPIFTADGARHI